MVDKVVTGKCLCGQISVSIPEVILNKSEHIGLCYYVTIQGEPKIYLDKDTKSGTTVRRAFCGNCGSPMFGKNPNFAGLMAIRLGCFDQLTKPGMVLFCKDRPQWDKSIDGTQENETMPEVTDEFKDWLKNVGVKI
ncbi:unnamed protein product [Adineta ricciae]|uniref:CENP-V/GFA domain-containing protein n=1 Tax=Adineta ricciae TaxID=249248 RepID=A0A815GGB8_ADIRI|nr:unnamed protein product [Adineta ricciae]